MGNIQLTQTDSKYTSTCTGNLQLQLVLEVATVVLAVNQLVCQHLDLLFRIDVVAEGNGRCVLHHRVLGGILPQHLLRHPVALDGEPVAHK